MKSPSELKILCCDDSLLIRRQLRSILEKQGYTNVLEANDGAEAVQMYEKEQPDLVFCDIVMPKLDGLEALKQIIQMDGNARVIMVSSSGTKLNLAQALKEGARDFIQKPFDQKQVTKVITRVTGGGENSV